jgi:hypothetical protein
MGEGGSEDAVFGLGSASSLRIPGPPLLPVEKLGRTEEARVELERAAALTRNERERTLLLERAASSK